MSKTFSQLRAELNEVGVKVEPTINDLNTNPSKDMGWIRSKNIPKSLPAPAKTTLKDVGKSILGAGGRLVSKFGPQAALSAATLAGSYQGGKLANDISGVNKVTDKIGKGIASGLQKMGIGKSPEVVKAKEREVSRKPADTGPKTTVQAQSGGGTVSFPTSQTTPSAPVKSIPVAKSATIKSALVAKSAPTKSPAAAPSKSAPVTKTAKPVSAPVVKSAPAKSTPVTKMAKPVSAPVKKSLPMATKPVEKDPNAGGGFVTARAYGSKTAGVTSTKNVYQNAKGRSTELSPTPRRDTMSGGKSIPQSSSSAPKSTSSGSKPSVKDLF